MLKNKKVMLVLAALAAAGFFIAARGLGQGSEEGLRGPTFETRKGPLIINVMESGTIQARDQVVIRSEVEGRNQLISLVPEGTRVKAGDLLVELDASDLEDLEIDLEIRVQNAEADLIRSQENLAITENQSTSDVELAELAYEFAKQDLQQYLDGEYPYELKRAESNITLAEEEYTRALERLNWSERLHAENYISETELQGDQLQAKRRELDLELSRGQLELLTDFTYTRQLAQLESDVNQARMALERARRRARADMIQAEADLKAREAEYNHQQRRLDRIRDQIEKTKIYAPADGLVIHATSVQGGRRQEPLEEGQDIRERQELIYLPSGDRLRADLTVHESNLDKIRLGMPVEITVDSMPDSRYYGEVAYIAPLPDPQSMWMNPDLKVYRTEVHLDRSSEVLRPGMNCRAEIIIEEHDDALHIPIQAVVRIAGQPNVFVRSENTFVPRPVSIGMDNNRMVHILDGIEQGQHVLLNPPLESGTVEPRIRPARPEPEDPQAPVAEQSDESTVSSPNAGQGQRPAGQRPGQGRGGQS